MAEASFGTYAALFWSAVGALVLAVVLWFRIMPSYPERPEGWRASGLGLRSAAVIATLATLGLGISFVVLVRSGPRSGFCSNHDCISNFDNGNGRNQSVVATLAC
jgi:hypothetical protein